MTVAMSMVAQNDVTACIPILTENVVTTFVTIEEHNAIAKTDNWLESIISGVINKADNEIFRSVEFQSALLCNIEDVKLSPEHLTKMTEARLDNQYFIAHGAIIMKEWTEKAVDI